MLNKVELAIRLFNLYKNLSCSMKFPPNRLVSIYDN
nr:MAG TPA_asm: hypothetical protein [Bacteriophage sp.]